MLRLMRKHAGSWIIKILLGIIIIVFVVSFNYSNQEKGDNRIASVNDDIILYNEYKTTRDNYIKQMRQNFGGELTEDIIKRLENEVLDGLINKRILFNEAQKLDIQITKEEVQSIVKGYDVFNVDDAFNEDRYRKVLDSNRLTPEIFEQQIIDDLLMKKMRETIAASVKVSEQEAKEWFDWKNTTVDINAVLFEPGDHKDIEPGEDELKAFFDKNNEKYLTKPKRNVRYLHFDPKDYQSKVNVSEEEVQEYYDSNYDEFYYTPKKVEARHILIPVKESDTEEIVNQKKEKCNELLNKIKKGEDFAELAKKFSEDPASKRNGGFLAAFKKEEMAPPFAEKAFSMKPGEVSEPVLTQFGWHIIKVEKIHEEKVKDIETEGPKISAKLLDKKADRAAREEAAEVYDVSIEGDDLVNVASERGLQVNITGLFEKQKPFRGVRNGLKFAQIAFNLSHMEIGDIEEFRDGYYLLQVFEEVPASTPDLKDVLTMVTSDLKKEMQDAEAKKQAKTVLAVLEKGGSLEEECGKIGKKVIHTGFFKRTGQVAKIGYEIEISKAAFNLSEKQKLSDSVIEGKKGYYILEFREQKKPDEAEFEKEKSGVMKRLLIRKKNDVFEAWLTHLKEGYEIIIADGYGQDEE